MKKAAKNNSVEKKDPDKKLLTFKWLPDIVIDFTKDFPKVPEKISTLSDNDLSDIHFQYRKLLGVVKDIESKLAGVLVEAKAKAKYATSAEKSIYAIQAAEVEKELLSAEGERKKIEEITMGFSRAISGRSNSSLKNFNGVTPEKWGKEIL